MFKWILVIIGGWLAYQVREQLPPFIVGMVIAYLLSRPVSMLCQHTRISRGWATLAIYVVTLTALGIAGWKGLPIAAEQATGLFNHRAIIVGNLIRQLSQATGWSPDVSAVTTQVLTKVQTFVTAQPQELLAVGGLLSRGLLFFLVALVSSIYFLKDASVFGAYFLRFVPEGKRDECTKVASEINHKFSKYISGQLLLVGIMAVLVFTILTCYHLKYALIVALIAGVLEIVPVFGPIAALILAASIAASQHGLEVAACVAGLVFAARMFEDYIVIPRVIGHAVELHPVVTIFFVLAGEQLCGGLGMLLAVPFAAACKVVLDHLYPPAEKHPNTTRGALTARWEQAKAVEADVHKAVSRGIKHLSDWVKSHKDK